MARISECQFCGNEGSSISGTKQAEMYDEIVEVFMCWKCELAAQFEQNRIIKLLEEQIKDSDLPVDKCVPHYHPIIGLCCCKLISLIKGDK